MSNAPTSIPDLIENWRTIAEFAADVGCGYEAARQMRLRGSIAPVHWENVITASARRGVRGVDMKWLAARHASVTKGVTA